MELSGTGFLSDAYDYLKRGVKDLRKNKTISKIGRSVGDWGIPVVSDVAKQVGNVADMFGFGKKMTGRGAYDIPL